jgi:Small-conductance mechanosensitive channel
LLFHFYLQLFLNKSEILRILIKIGIVITIIFFISVLNTIIRIVYILISKKSKFKQKPLKGFFQIVQIILYFLGAIVIVSIIINKSPAGLLAGLGAFAAVLSLIFKDIILGFISGIQLSANDMVRPGDWIVVPNSLANGVVIDITLITIKVQNFDNTIVTVPTYSLIASPFQNWRGMEESGGRRITVALNIDMLSVKFLLPDELLKYSAYVELPQHFKQNKITNMLLYRFYMNTYLHKNSNIDNSMLTMVRYLEPSTLGVPMQLYCFSNNIDWVVYEGIKSEIIEHAIAMAAVFELKIYQTLSELPNN